jgi:hypothetical protein
MGERYLAGRLPAGWMALILIGAALAGCQSFMKVLSSHLTNWQMLDQTALEDPIKAVGGDGIVFLPRQESAPLTRRQLAAANPETLVSYYAPVFVQQRINTQTQAHPYPPEYDLIGEAHLRREANDKLKSYVAGQPKVYAIFKEVAIDGGQHDQITYTAWYPAHPRIKAFDVEAADIDSCVVRVTLDADHAPLFFETIAACGCFHKIFVEGWIEDRARHDFGPPQKDKQFCVERSVAMGLTGRWAALSTSRATGRSDRSFFSRRENTRSSAWAVRLAFACRPRRKSTPTR